MQEDTFQIVEALEVSGRGLVVITNQRHHSFGRQLYVGQRVAFRTPDGQQVASSLRSLELFSSPFNPNKPLAFVVAEGVSKEQLPSGTVITFAS
jgi:hypothetical protein